MLRRPWASGKNATHALSLARRSVSRMAAGIS
jgi:hypothetical protein